MDMDTQTLKERLRGFIPADYEWKFTLYNTHKSEDGVELEFHLCKMRDVPQLTGSIAAAMLEKTLEDRVVEPYSPFLPKESVGALEKSDERIREPLYDALLNIRKGMEQAPEDFISGAIARPAGYGFYGCRRDESGAVTKEALFLRRANPFITGKSMRLCTAVADEISESKDPVLKFTHGTDFLLMDGVCYFFSAGIEKDFNLENRHIAICAKRMKSIAEAAIVSNYDQLEKEAMFGKNARKFADFDQKILEHISGLSIMERIDFLGTYGITIDHEGRMDTFDAEQCGLVIDLLCCRSCLDPLGRLSTGDNITPR